MGFQKWHTIATGNFPSVMFLMIPSDEQGNNNLNVWTQKRII